MNWPWLELQIVRLPVGGGRHHAGMRLDIGLMHRGVGVAPLDDDISVAEAGVEIALGEPDHLGDVGCVCRLGIDALGEQVVVQYRRVGLHRLFDVDDVRQYVVVDLDQFTGLLGDRRRGRGDGCHRMAVVEHLVARQAVARQVAEVHRTFADKGFLRRDRRKVLRSDDGFDAGQGAGLLGVDGHDAGMGVRAALDFAPQHPRHHHVGAEIGLPGHFVDPVRADRAGADDLLQFLWHIRHANLTPVLRRPREGGSPGQAMDRIATAIPVCGGNDGVRIPTPPQRAAVPLRPTPPAAAAATSADRASGSRSRRR